jgi:hypothetical protein
MTNLLALNAGTELVGDYRIDRVLGAGGFGITYLADEMALDRRVTIKEYFPSDYAVRGGSADALPRSQECASDYRWGLDRFIEEAQTLARFDHPHIVRVYRYFQANNTAYMVLHFEEGQSLKSWLKGLGRAVRQKELDRIVAPLLDALEVVHKADYLHRDIAPDNIIIRKDGAPVLIDFGAARGEIAAHSKTVSALVKPGYSPYEQYAETSRQQGPWTDIYALGATLYHAITGKRPPDAPSRMVKDEYIPAREAALSSYRASFLAAIDKALALSIEARPQSVAAWRGDLLAPDPPKPGWLGRGMAAKRADKAEPLVPPQPSKAQTVVVPPPPDAPGQQGGMLDFIEGLQKKPESAAAPPPAAAPAEPNAPPGAPSERAPRAPASAKAEAPVPEPVPKSQPRKEEAPRIRRARPRRMRGDGGSWRPLLLKLMVGAGIASGAVALQGKLPQIETRGAGIVSSQSSERLELAQLKGHKSAVAALAFSDDGRQIVTAGRDATLRIWSAASGALQRTIELDNGAASALAVQGRRALSGHADGTIVLWDLDKAEKVSTFRRNEAAIWSLAFLGEPGRFAAAAHDWSVAMWDVRGSGGPLHVFEGHESAANSVAYSARGPWIASGSADRTVKLWSLSNLALIRTYRGHKDFVTALAFAPDGRVMASASLDGGIRIWSTSSNRLYRTLSGHKGRVGGLAFSPAGDLLASGGEDGIVKLWDFKTGRALRLLAGHSGPVRSVAFATDGRRVATASEDSTVRTWDAIIPRRDKDSERD